MDTRGGGGGDGGADAVDGSGGRGDSGGGGVLFLPSSPLPTSPLSLSSSSSLFFRSSLSLPLFRTYPRNAVEILNLI